MTNCDAIRRLLEEDGAEAVEAHSDIQSHIEGCPSCTRLLDNLHVIEAGLQDLPPQKMPDKLAADILRAVRAQGHNTTSSLQAPARWLRLGGLFETLFMAAGQSLQLSLRQKWVVVGTVAGVMLVSGLSVFSSGPHYTAISLVEIRPPRIVEYEAVLAGLPADTETIETEIQIIRSRNLIAKTAERLKLNRNPEFNPALRPASIFAILQEEVGNYFAQPRLTTFSSTDEVEEPSQTERNVKEQTQIIDAVLDSLTVDRIGLSRVVEIEFESENPRTAALVANTLVDYYIVAQLEAKFSATKRANNWLNFRISELRKEAMAAEKAIEEFREKSGLIRGQRGFTLASERISELGKQYMHERAKLAEAEARLRQVEGLLKSPDGIESAGEVLASVLIRSLREQEDELDILTAQISAELGERHPRMIDARAQLRDLQEKIRVEVGRIVQGLRNEVGVARARAATLRAELEKHKREVAQLDTKQVQLRVLELEAEASWALLETLLARSKELASQQGFQEADANILSYASVPERFSYPKAGMILGVAFVGSLGIGLFLAFVIERLKTNNRNSTAQRKWVVAGTVAVVILVSVVSMFSSVLRNTAEVVLKIEPRQTQVADTVGAKPPPAGTPVVMLGDRARGAVTEEQVAPGAAAAGFMVELSAFGTAEVTMRERKRLQDDLSDLLGNTELTVERIDLGERGVQYQVQASHFPDRLTANYMCARVRARKGYCQVVTPAYVARALNDAKTTNPAIASRPRISPASGEENGKYYAHAGVQAQNSGDYGKAIDFYSLAIESDDLSRNDLARVFNNRGAAYKKMEFYDLAIDDYSNAIQLKQDYARAYYNRGIALGSKGLLDDAIRDYSTAIQLNPDDAATYNNRGLAYERAGLHKKAIADFSRAISLAPDLSYAYYNRGLAYEGAKKRRRAIMDFRKSYSLNPDNSTYQAKMKDIGLLQ